MTTKTFFLISAAAVALQFAPAVSAQSADNVEGRHHARRERMLANLSPDEQAKFRAAHKAAMADPTVQAAKEKAKTDRTRESRQEFRAARRAAMLKADPSIQAILDKMPNRAGRNS